MAPALQESLARSAGPGARVTSSTQGSLRVLELTLPWAGQTLRWQVRHRTAPIARARPGRFLRVRAHRFAAPRTWHTLITPPQPPCQVLRDLARPDLAPDVVWEPRDFAPLADAACSAGSAPGPPSSSGARADAATHAAADGGRLRQLLSDWGKSGGAASEAEKLGALLAALLGAFQARQRQRLASLGDERVAFELGMAEDTGCSQLLLTGERAVLLFAAVCASWLC